jgi:hypothetical protein
MPIFLRKIKVFDGFEPTVCGEGVCNRILPLRLRSLSDARVRLSFAVMLQEKPRLWLGVRGGAL